MSALGAFHGLNPAMGWLFAVALGLQRRSQRAVLVSLLPIAAGHAVSVAAVGAIVWGGLRVVTGSSMTLTAACVLLLFGMYKLFNTYRHPRWVGMKVGLGDLFVWSFLMATGHGAGLMVAPLFVSLGAPGAHHHGPAAIDTSSPVALASGLLAHTCAMLAVMAGVAWVVYARVGLAVLKRGWINFDMIWATALLIAGASALIAAL